jgi:hypothetical protein
MKQKNQISYTNEKPKTKNRFNKNIYQVKFIFSSGKKYNSQKEASAFTLFGYISGKELNQKGIKKSITDYAERNNIPAGYYAHIADLD